MDTSKRILLKLTGEIFLSEDKKSLSATAINHIIDQIKKLSPNYTFGIVVGGGNFFRGNVQGTLFGMRQASGHEVGMLATMMNGLILKDLLEQQELSSTLFCAISCAQIGTSISQHAIDTALQHQHILIFTGGTGNPFFTTDTNAVLRSLQMQAHEIWKGTNVDGVYSADPRKNADAKLLKKITYQDALKNSLGIMDTTAYALAQQHKQRIRVFNIFTPNALLLAADDENFGSIIQ